MSHQLLFISLLGVLVCSRDAFASDEEPQAPDAWVLHAEALSAELDGQIDRAIDLLKTAIQKQPGEEVILYDFARLVFQRRAAGWQNDIEPFLQVTTTTQASTTLQQSVRESLAGKIVTESQMNSSPALYSSVSSEEKPSLTLRLRASFQADSNATVLPESATDENAGIKAQKPIFAQREQTDASLTIGTKREHYTASATLLFQHGSYLNNRSTLSLYDSGLVAMAARVEVTSKLITTLDLLAGQVFLDGFNTSFLQDATGQLEVRLPLSDLQVGGFVFSSVRDFIGRDIKDDVSTIVGNAEGTPNDRDGVLGRGGFAARLKMGSFVAHTQLGWQRDFAEGRRMQHQGPAGRVMLQWSVARLSLHGGATYEMRDYFHYDIDANDGVNDKRRDHRITPTLGASITLFSWLRLVGSYVWIRNVSTSLYSYQRHLAQLGLEARW